MNFLNGVKQSPIQGLSGFGGGVTNYQFFSGGSDPVFPEEVFSVNAIQGDGGTGQAIVNGIDLSGEGGLVIFKSNPEDAAGGDPCWYDTVRGNGKLLNATEDDGQTTNSTNPWTPTSTGFNTGDNFGGSENPSERTTALTFRKCKGFFDVVQYTGTGSAQAISHSLGSTPGFIITKLISADQTSNSDGGFWSAWHRSLGDDKYINIGNFIGNAATDTTVWNNTAPTATQFTVGTAQRTNDSGKTYIAYLWGHNDASFGTDKDQPIIHCGTYTGTQSVGTPNITGWGFSPQFMMVRRYDGGGSSGPLRCIDYINGMTSTGNEYAGSEYTIAGTSGSMKGNQSADLGTPTDDGYQFLSGNVSWNENNQNWIYIAIGKPTMDKDDYENQGYTFNSDYIFRDKIAQNATPAFVIDNPGWAPDFSYCRGYGGNNQFYSTARRNGKDTRQMKQGSTNWETEYDQETNEDWRFGSTGKSMTTSTASPSQGGYYHTGRTGSYYSGAMWRNFPKSFSSTTWKGTGSAQAHDHGLGTTPEMIAVGTIDSSALFYFWHSGFAQHGYSNSYYLNWANNEQVQQSGSGNITVTSTQYTPNTESSTGSGSNQYWGGFWATVPGLTKVGYYEGTGSNNFIDAGFSTGTKFLMLKRLDSTQTSGNGRWVILSNLSDGQTDSNWAITTQSQHSSKGHFTSYNGDVSYNYQTLRGTNAGFGLIQQASGWNYDNNKYIYYAVAKV